jgi:hypothetical protein
LGFLLGSPALSVSLAICSIVELEAHFTCILQHLVLFAATIHIGLA